MATKQLVETSLALGGAALGAAGAVLLEPFVIGAGAIAAGVGAYMRYQDQREEREQAAKRQTILFGTRK
jgi:hypothetical protein